MDGVRKLEMNYTRWDGTEDHVDERGNSVSADSPEKSEGGETNAARTRARNGSGFTDTGNTPSGDSIYAGFAAVKGRVAPAAGLDLEVLTVSAQVGGQNEVQAAQARVGFATESGRDAIATEVFGVRAGFGRRNADGSFGINAGVGAVAIGVEATLAFGSAWSVTGGASVGVGAEGSVGLRDIDSDERPEICVRAGAGWWTLGGCAELPLLGPISIRQRADSTNGDHADTAVQRHGPHRGQGDGVLRGVIHGHGSTRGSDAIVGAAFSLPLLGTLGFGCLSYFAARTFLRAKRVFGSAQGIVLNDPESSEVVPWNRVGEVECPLSSFNPVLRTYYVTLLDRSERLYFFARQRELRQWAELRASARSSA